MEYLALDSALPISFEFDFLNNYLHVKAGRIRDPWL